MAANAAMSRQLMDLARHVANELQQPVILPPENVRTVHSLTAGRITRAGWQNPGDPDSGLGWRVWVTDDYGNQMGYGHLDPSSTPPVGTKINPGDSLGLYADPTNGFSTAPHVHVQAYDRAGNPMDPGAMSPLTRGRMTTPFGGRDAMTGRMGHNGVDWAAPR
jgi:murein DD-endopeptidase MepM/ murein hydrolase activator NlpD